MTNFKHKVTLCMSVSFITLSFPGCGDQKEKNGEETSPKDRQINSENSEGNKEAETPDSESQVVPDRGDAPSESAEEREGDSKDTDEPDPETDDAETDVNDDDDEIIDTSTDIKSDAGDETDSDKGDTDDMNQSDCGASKLKETPFGCALAWGTNDPGGDLSGLGYLDFITKWVGYEVEEDGTLTGCDGCSWLENQVSKTDLLPVYYAYFVGFFGHANGFQDGNQNPSGPNLTTNGAELIRNNWDQIVGMYEWYASKTAKTWGDKTLIWLLEGDYVQYLGESQSHPLSYAELAEFASQVTCAIKENMPSAVVAINHSTWNPDQVTDDFWRAMEVAKARYDMVWTTGVADNLGYLESAAHDGYYNQATATYAYISELTGRKIFVDTSFGLSAMADTWASANVETLNARIGEGVIAVNVTSIPAGYQNSINELSPWLDSTCK